MTLSASEVTHSVQHTTSGSTGRLAARAFTGCRACVRPADLARVRPSSLEQSADGAAAFGRLWPTAA